MTIETKTTIQLSDITTVEFECSNCGGIVSWPIAGTPRIPVSCQCGAQQWMPIGSTLYVSLCKFIELAKQLGEMTGEHFALRFGIKNDAVLVRAANDKD
jgi:hypothetical protein